jgi:hypothetical protein
MQAQRKLLDAQRWQGFRRLAHRGRRSSFRQHVGGKILLELTPAANDVRAQFGVWLIPAVPGIHEVAFCIPC